jgi:3-oxosteroid 1-dehydrogenase
VRKYGIAGAKGRRQLNKWQQAGYLKVSTSIAGLAQEIGCDPAVLTATVERFNGFVRNGNDEDFGRGSRQYDLWLGDRFNQDGPSETLGTLEQGPFYAVPIVPGDVGTYGGVVTDEYARVLRDDGSVVGGLYATGVCTASVFGRVYPGAGASIGPAYTFGYIAAKHAVQQASTA